MRIDTTLAAIFTLIAFEAQAQTNDAKSEEKPKLICRTVATTGTRLGAKKVCATAKEWDQRADEDSRTVDGWAKRTVYKTQ